MEKTHTTNCFCLGEIMVEPERHTITAGHHKQRLTAREMEVLMVLVEHKNQVVSREKLLSDVWNDVVVNEETLTLTISRLRKAFSDDPKRPNLIETIPKKGYRLIIAPTPCDTVDAKQRPKIYRRPLVWIAVLSMLLLLSISMFIRVSTEYVKLSEPPENTIQNQHAP